MELRREPLDKHAARRLSFIYLKNRLVGLCALKTNNSCPYMVLGGERGRSRVQEGDGWHEEGLEVGRNMSRGDKGVGWGG